MKLNGYLLRSLDIHRLGDQGETLLPSWIFLRSHLRFLDHPRTI